MRPLPPAGVPGDTPAMHTHFGSATLGASAFLSVVLFGTLWRLGWQHGVLSSNPWVAGLSRAALYQF